MSLGFFAAVSQIFTAIGTTASVVNRSANALDNLGKWSEIKTATFVDEAEFERQQAQDQLLTKRAEYAKKLKMLEATATAQIQ